MKLEKSLSKLAKSISKGAEITVKKSEDLLSISRLNIEISSIEDSIEKLYIEIGEYVYKKYCKGKFSEHELEDYFKSLNKYNKEITKFKKEIAKIKSRRDCSTCGHEISSTSKYCPICGTKQGR
jgi:rubrerythrin